MVEENKQSNLHELTAIILEGCKKISNVLRNSGIPNKEKTQNKFGDIQLDIDMSCDDIFFDTLRESGLVSMALSEEKPEPQYMDGNGYIVTFDPLDGSSVIDTNFSVGTIFGIWPGSGIDGKTCSSMITAGMIVYGPRTTALVINNFGEVDELTLINKNGTESWVVTRQNLKIAEKAKIFAPANLKATVDNEIYRNIYEQWREDKLTLRYTGAMVPDVYQIFIKGNGIFANMISDTAPAKLRLLYEVAPVSKIVEAAGGLTTNGRCSIMDIVIDGYCQKTPMCVGSKLDVLKFLP